MSQILEIQELGSPILRQKAKQVENINDKNIQLLMDNMIKTVIKYKGVGLSAPQVNESLKIFILASHPNPRYPNAPQMQPTAIINPKIISCSDQKEKDWEGCLCIPGIRGLVPRYKHIFTEYTTSEGEKKKQKFSDFIARIFQHELDHLNGIVYLDRLDSIKNIITDKEYFKLFP